jgi:helix-turn-helix protein
MEAKGDQKELNEIFNKLVASGLAGEVRKRPGRKRKEVATKDAPIPGFE